MTYPQEYKEKVRKKIRLFAGNGDVIKEWSTTNNISWLNGVAIFLCRNRLIQIGGTVLVEDQESCIKGE